MKEYVLRITIEDNELLSKALSVERLVAFSDEDLSSGKIDINETIQDMISSLESAKKPL